MSEPIKSALMHVPVHGDLLIVSVQSFGERLTRAQVIKAIHFLTEVVEDIESEPLPTGVSVGPKEDL